MKNWTLLEVKDYLKIYYKKLQDYTLYIFNDWNGLQNFVMPSLLLYFFDHSSYVVWILGIFTFYKYYIPLVFYLIFAGGIGFSLLKIFADWKLDISQGIDPETDRMRLRSYLYAFTIQVHKHLVLYITMYVLVFVIKSGLEYFYQYNLSLFQSYYWLLKLGFICYFSYLYFFFGITIPKAKKGVSFALCQKYFWTLMVNKWRKALPIVLVHMTWIFCSIMVFNLLCLIIDRFLFSIDSPFWDNSHRILFSEGETIWQFLVNFSLIIVGFIVSNLLYAPLMVLLNKGLKYYSFSLSDIANAES